MIMLFPAPTALVACDVMRAREVTAEDLRAALNAEAPRAAVGPSAAVALVFRHGDAGTELLFIQRASKDSDPWSGHMAFPGGRTDLTDRNSCHTAERETLEEVGLDLDPADRLGSLDDLQPAGRPGSLDAIHGHGYWLGGASPTLTGNYEVADIVWVPLSMLADAKRRVEYYYERSNSAWPGIQLDKSTQVVWGLTLRFLADLFARLHIDFIELRPYSQ